MSILQELTSITILVEAPEVPIELKKLFSGDVSSNFAKKALAKLWGGSRLMWHGQRFFANEELGPAYHGALKAATEYVNDGYTAEVEMDIDSTSQAKVKEPRADDEGEEDTEADGPIDLRFEVKFSDHDGGDRQECYLGYDGKRDKLYIGFDAWTSEEDFHTAFEKAFEKATGKEFNIDKSEHEVVFSKAWKQYQSESHGHWGLLFEITDEDGSFAAEEAMPPMQGGFYKNMYQIFKRQNKDVADLRLD